MGEKRKVGVPRGTRNRAKGKHPRTMISLSGLVNDKIIDGLSAQGVEPTPQTVTQVIEDALMDWDLFFPDRPLSDEEEAELQRQEEKRKAEREAVGIVRADYQAFRYLESLPLKKLREIVAEGPFPVNPETNGPFTEADYQDSEHNQKMAECYLRRHRQAVVVLEQKEIAAHPGVLRDIE